MQISGDFGGIAHDGDAGEEQSAISIGPFRNSSRLFHTSVALLSAEMEFKIPVDANFGLHPASKVRHSPTPQGRLQREQAVYPDGEAVNSSNVHV